MKPIKLFKALSNESRLQILRWLRDPTRHFASLLNDQKIKGIDPIKIGVSVTLIQQKTGLSQSTVSQFLSMLQDVDLIKATRIGQWTYYRRNEAQIVIISKYLTTEF